MVMNGFIRVVSLWLRRTLGEISPNFTTATMHWLMGSWQNPTRTQERRMISFTAWSSDTLKTSMMQRKYRQRSLPSTSWLTTLPPSPLSNYRGKLFVTTKDGTMTLGWLPSTSLSAAAPYRTSRGSTLFAKRWKCTFSRPSTNLRRISLTAALAARLDWMRLCLKVMTRIRFRWRSRITSGQTASPRR